MHDDQLHDLLFKTLETELGGVFVYSRAWLGVKNDDLRKEWGQLPRAENPPYGDRRRDPLCLWARSVH